MTGTRWLGRLTREGHSPVERRRAMVRRIRRKARDMSPDTAKDLLESFGQFQPGGGATAVHDVSVRWIGCWSQSLDDVIKRELGRRAGVIR